jgi:Family of unknown function (DUF6178)
MSDKPSKIDRVPLMAKATPEEGVALLAGLPALDAFNLALENPNPEKVLGLVPVESMYLMLHEIGTDDALMLLELASPEQIQGFIDIDCWDKDRLDLAKTRTWFLLLNELDDDRFIRDMKAMDLSLLVAFLERQLEVHKIENLDDEIEVEGAAFLTPDNRFLVHYTCSVEQSRLINAIMVRIYDHDPEFFALLFEALYWESGAEIEESAYTERNERLGSRGFPDYFDALELLAVVEVERFKPRKKTARSAASEAPGAHIGSSNYLTHYAHPDSLLRRALTADFAEREDVALEIMGLANMAVVAGRVPFFELEKVRGLVARTDGYLSIGLEYLVGQDEQAARDQLTTYRCLDLHKIGRSLMMRQAHRAKRLLPKVSLDGKSRAKLFIDGPEAETLVGLLEREPQQIVDGHEKVWSSLAQVGEVETTLTRVAKLAEVMAKHFGFTITQILGLPLHGANLHDPAELTYRVLFNTLLCHDLLGLEPTAEPLLPGDLTRLAGELVTDERGRAALPAKQREQMDHWLNTTLGEADAALLAPTLNRWVAALVTELARDDISPKFRGQLLVRLV